jgi:hypothetical protein
MDQPLRPGLEALCQGAEGDALGPWIAGPPRPAGESGPGGAPGAEASATRAIRAGKGPLASVVCLAGGPAGPVAAPKSLAVRAGKARPGFTPLHRPGLVVGLVLGGLVVTAGYGVYNGMATMDRLANLAEQDQSIREYNAARNVLVRHLAKDRGGGLARLKSYAAWMDRKQREQDQDQGQDQGPAVSRGEIVYTPPDGGPAQRTHVKAVLGDLRRQVDQDIHAMEEWTPPPLLKGYEDSRFEQADLLASRLPVSALMAAGLLALIVWSALAYRNLAALGVPFTSFKPGTVPLLWFAPVANLFLPCSVMGEIWNGSAPSRLRDASSLHLPVVGLWWPMLLAGIALLAISISRMSVAVGVAQMARAAELAVYADIGSMMVGALTLALVAGVSWNQLRRYNLAMTMEQHLGPGELWRRD